MNTRSPRRHRPALPDSTATAVPDYLPLDLSPYCNAGAEVIQSPETPSLGEVTLRGIPFRIGATGPRDRVLPVDFRPWVAFGTDHRSEPLELGVRRTARTVVFAHLMIESQVPFNGPIGGMVAEYVFHLEDGRRIVTPIRESFEIGSRSRPDLPPNEMLAWHSASMTFGAVADQMDRLFPRRGGSWMLAGPRMMGAESPSATGYKLWVWRNPTPSGLAAIEIRPLGPAFLIAGITLGFIDEDPFPRTGREPVTIKLDDTLGIVDPSELEVRVDRGVSDYVWPLLDGSTTAFVETPVKGWGETIDVVDGTAYVEIAAASSATVEIRKGDLVIGSVRWADVLRDGSARDPGRLSIEWVDRSRTWVHTTVLDEATGRPIPCRIHFRSASGIPWQPHGHHNHHNGDMPSWNMDIGGDVRLGSVPYAVIDGRCQGWLPDGEVLIEVVRGFEYEPLRTVTRIVPGQRELVLTIRRWTDLRREGWISGDTHVHILSASGSHLEAAAEDLHVVNVLQAQFGQLFSSQEDFTGHPSVSPDGETIVHVGQENRQRVLGHLGLLGLVAPVMPWSTDGPGEAEIGGTLEVTLSHWADQGRANGALVTLPHFAFPNGETAALIATGRVDAIEMTHFGRYFHEEYYRYLNAGYRLPLVGGTDKMTSEVPVGLYRTYARLAPDAPFTFEAWLAAVAQGRTFMSAGPIVRLRVEGRDVGETVRLPAGGGTLYIGASAESATPFAILQIVLAGKVVAEVAAPTGAHRLDLSESVVVGADTWIAARAGGIDYYDARRTPDSFNRGVFAHTSPVYVATTAGDWSMSDPVTIDHMITRVEAARAYVRDVAPTSWHARVGHAHGETDHHAFLERPFEEARARLMERRSNGW